jgi:hypothetical protein
MCNAIARIKEGGAENTTKAARDAKLAEIKRFTAAAVVIVIVVVIAVVVAVVVQAGIITRITGILRVVSFGKNATLSALFPYANSPGPKLGLCVI